jgi:hypothetical protein
MKLEVALLVTTNVFLPQITSHGWGKPTLSSSSLGANAQRRQVRVTLNNI